MARKKISEETIRLENIILPNIDDIYKEGDPDDPMDLTTLNYKYFKLKFDQDMNKTKIKLVDNITKEPEIITSDHVIIIPVYYDNKVTCICTDKNDFKNIKCKGYDVFNLRLSSTGVSCANCPYKEDREHYRRNFTDKMFLLIGQPTEEENTYKFDLGVKIETIGTYTEKTTNIMLHRAISSLRKSSGVNSKLKMVIKIGIKSGTTQKGGVYATFDLSDIELIHVLNDEQYNIVKDLKNKIHEFNEEYYRNYIEKARKAAELNINEDITNSKTEEVEDNDVDPEDLTEEELKDIL